MRTLLFVTYSLRRGGAEHVLTSYLEHADSKENIHIHLLTFEDQGPHKERIERLKNVTYHSLHLDKRRVNFLTQSLKMRKLIRQLDPEKTISFLYYPNIICYLATIGTKANHIPCELNNHRKYIGQGMKWMLWSFLLKKCYQHAEVVVCNALKQKEMICEDFKIFEEKTKTIYSGIDLKKLTSLSKEKVNIEGIDGHKLVVAVGRLSKQKQYPILFQAFKNVIESIEDKIKLLIVGGGRLEQELRKYVIKLKLENSIILYGQTDNPYPFMKMADVYVLSSSYEGFPNALIEAFWLNGYVVSTNCETGPDEIITDESDGLLVTVDDPESIAEGLKRMLSDEDLRRKVYINSRKKAPEFRISLMFDAFDRLFFR